MTPAFAVPPLTDFKKSAPISVLFIGDIVGRPGRRAVAARLPALLARHRPELVVANVENSAGGSGVTADGLKELDDAGCQVYTTGNHVWHKADGLKLLENNPRLLRPANYPRRNPGRGCGVFAGRTGLKIGVMNLAGRVFMDPSQASQSPFDAAESCLAEIGCETHTSIVDIHAEATSEKVALGWYLNGRASAVLGTHTHVQTADERVLPGGTAYITDAGMTGPVDSVIGMGKRAIIEKFLTGMPRRYEVARTGQLGLNAVLVKIYHGSGRAFSIERLQEVWQQ